MKAAVSNPISGLSLLISDEIKALIESGALAAVYHPEQRRLVFSAAGDGNHIVHPSTPSSRHPWRVQLPSPAGLPNFGVIDIDLDWRPATKTLCCTLPKDLPQPITRNRKKPDTPSNQRVLVLERERPATALIMEQLGNDSLEFNVSLLKAVEIVAMIRNMERAA